MLLAEKNIHNYWDVTVELQNGNGSGRELGIDKWEKWEWDKVSEGNGNGMGMGMKSLKLEGFGKKSPHISSPNQGKQGTRLIFYHSSK